MGPHVRRRLRPGESGRAAWSRNTRLVVGGGEELRNVGVLARSSEGNGKQARYRFLFENETALVALHQDRDGLIERLGISLE